MTKNVVNEVTLEVENIGGIDETAIDFRPGVNVLVGENATNRTSLLQAVTAAMGGESASLKSDADMGNVSLYFDDESYSRKIIDQNGTLRFSGEPMTDNASLVDLFAVLLESNDARQSVSRGENLREVIMEPVDTTEIEAEIRSLQKQRDNLESELESIDEKRDRLEELQRRRSDLETEIEDLSETLEKHERTLEQLDTDRAEAEEEKGVLSERLSELSDVESELSSIEHRLETERASIDSLEEEQADVETLLNELSEESEFNQDELEGELSRLRERKNSLDTVISRLRNIVQFNRDMLGGGTQAQSVLQDHHGVDGKVTDELLAEGGNTLCWTCGSEVSVGEISSMNEETEALLQDQIDERASLEEKIDKLQSRLDDVHSAEQRRIDLREREDNITSELESRQSRIEKLEEEHEEYRQRRDELEEEVRKLRSDREDDEYLDLLEEKNRVEVELNQLRSDLDRLNEELDELEAEIEREPHLEGELEDVKESIKRQRHRIDRLETAAVESFNKHMENLLDILDFDNISRIWLEQVEKEVKEGRRKVSKTDFELHVVRSTAGGEMYRDSINHLSESEREVTGLVFALSGYLAHEIYEKVPFLLLDSLEAIDADRIGELIEYFEDYSDHIVVALLTEDARELPERYAYIEDF